MKNTSQNTQITPRIPPGIDVKGISDSIIEQEFIRIPFQQVSELAVQTILFCISDLSLQIRSGNSLQLFFSTAETRLLRRKYCLKERSQHQQFTLEK